ncbi:wall-associated receptor kinase 3 [Selaginella moellendorffii]|nr:wall-associated receptor kinase 3 [Selaginella moellendorffii]|eukprot:XP_002980244.2 wall-associated receptor kinase 3 [Selaginella moellendorffii]
MDAALTAVYLFLFHAAAQDLCSRKCGSFTADYPFGFDRGCGPPEFELNCSSAGKPLLQTVAGQFEILEATATTLIVETSRLKSNSCTGAEAFFDVGSTAPYTLSANNEFFARGCSVEGSYTADAESTQHCETGCQPGREPNIRNPFCEELECCILTIPSGKRSVIIKSSANNGTSDCGYSSVIFPPSYQVVTYGIELLWAMPGNCSTSAHLCSLNATCLDAPHQPGFFNCICNTGSGNGFSNGTGCSAVVDHCASSPCSEGAICVNDLNSFTCKCRQGYKGNATSGCRKTDVFQHITSGPVLLVVAAAILAGSICVCIVRTKKLGRKKGLFPKLGSLAHLQLEFKQNATFFSFDELSRATQNFKAELMLGTGSFGTVFQGVLDDDTPVAIKKANSTTGPRIQQFLNEVTILSQVNHRNLVKLLGCCLETEVPLLVFEFVPNGTLFEHLQHRRSSILSWERRLQIAIETAEAISYLHSSAAQPIYHRDVKSTNILLDEKFTAKVADFGISKLVSLEATHVSTTVHGTPGYIDPQYQQNYQLTDKSDVYSFGVVLLELITGQKPVDFSRNSSDKNLTAFSLAYIQSSRIEDIIDKGLELGDERAKISSIQEVANLAIRCLEFNRENRPAMRSVAEELMKISAAS